MMCITITKAFSKLGSILRTALIRSAPLSSDVTSSSIFSMYVIIKMTPFNGFTILVAVMLILVLITQGFSLYAESAKHKPQTAQDTVNFVAGTIFIISGVVITLKTYDALK